ncbi:hypothetical protein ABTM77_21115, partial [Acinetobacter baumannii]
DEMRAMIGRDFPDITKTRRDALIKEALSDAGLPSPSELFKTARGRAGEFAKQLTDDPKTERMTLLELSDEAKRRFKVGTHIA